MTEWQPIKTAPKDGTVIDLWIPIDEWSWDGKSKNDIKNDGKTWDYISAMRVCDAYWSEIFNVWVDRVGDDISEFYDEQPTHWMRRPTPPE